MGYYHVRVEQVIAASPAQLYAIVADYQAGHRKILPPAYFRELVVEQGGRGTGTVVRTVMEVMGSRRTFRLEVSEPQPGRVLQETDPTTGTVTTFTFDPLGEGRETRVVIETKAPTSPGFIGWVERLLNPRLLRRIYQDELALLAGVVAQHQSAGS